MAWRKKLTKAMQERCMTCKNNQAHKYKYPYLEEIGKVVIDCSIGNPHRTYCGYYMPENVKHEVCQDEKCMGFRMELVDRGYGYLVCPTTPTNPRRGHEI